MGFLKFLNELRQIGFKAINENWSPLEYMEALEDLCEKYYGTRDLQVCKELIKKDYLELTRLLLGYETL